MRIITHTCPNCGTVVAGNVLESRREMKCPRQGCDDVLQFSDLDYADREHILEHRDRYRLE
jgi:SUMO ligase MMS21 Smc5/6 complex component